MTRPLERSTVASGSRGFRPVGDPPAQGGFPSPAAGAPPAWKAAPDAVKPPRPARPMPWPPVPSFQISKNPQKIPIPKICHSPTEFRYSIAVWMRLSPGRTVLAHLHTQCCPYPARRARSWFNSTWDARNAGRACVRWYSCRPSTNRGRLYVTVSATCRNEMRYCDVFRYRHI